MREGAAPLPSSRAREETVPSTPWPATAVKPLTAWQRFEGLGKGVLGVLDQFRSMVALVGQLLAADPSAMHSAETLSKKLHLSLRTLHRQLKEEGASLQALKDEVRRERAIALLLRTSRPIKRVAQACGFLNDKSFIRAFRLWTGLSPSEFRKTAGQRAV